MKKILFAMSVLAVVALSAGIFVMVSCSEEKGMTAAGTAVSVPNASSGSIGSSGTQISTNQGLVSVTSVNANPESNSVEFQLQLEQPGGPTIQRRLEMRLSEDSLNNVLLTSSLLDENDVNLWNMHYAVGSAADGSLSLTITTPTKTIVAERTVSRDSITESYAIGSSTYSLAFAVGDRSKVEALAQSGIPRGSYPPEEKQIRFMVQDLLEFYEGNNQFSLGPDAELAGALINDQALIHQFTEMLYSNPDANSTLFLREICTAAATCAFTSCMMGPNPVCDVCGAVAVTCALMDQFFPGAIDNC